MSTPERDLIVGGQAVIEGVMMRTPNAYAIAVRKADGTIVNISARLPKWSDKYPLLKLPVLRGGAVLVQSMGLGIKALNYSASEALADPQTSEVEEVKIALSPAVIEGEGDFAGLTGAVPGLFPVPTQKRSKDELKRGATTAAAGSIVFALFFNVLIFVAAPLLLTNALFIAAGWATPAVTAVSTSETTGAPAVVSSTGVPRVEPDETWSTKTWRGVRTYLRPVRPSIAFNLIDGLIRMSFFLIMIVSFSLVKDIRRVFEYHGAEHKTVFAFENGDPLNSAEVQKYTTFHPRCGTSFLMTVMIISMIVYMVIPVHTFWARFGIRIALLPLIAGVSYEIIRFAAKHRGSLFALMTTPGLWLQRITTQPPDDRQVECAIVALDEAMALEKQRGGELVIA